MFDMFGELQGVGVKGASERVICFSLLNVAAKVWISHWSKLNYFSIPEPITVARGMEYAK